MTIPSNREAHTTIDVGSAANADGSAFVVVVERGGSRLVDLPEGLELSIGRSRSNGVFLDDAAASRLHAVILWTGGPEACIRDPGSRNGTFIDGRRLDGEATLTAGSKIQIGEAVLTVLFPTRPNQVVEADGVIAEDARSQALLVTAQRLARTPLPILLLGETGVGKELIANHIHSCSPRASGPFLSLNCGAIQESLAESSLFGHERGAFTGADRAHQGVFEAANGGTLLLDEVGELSPSNQVRLLRTLENATVVRVGSTRARPIDVRVIAATHRDLDARVKEGSFRADLLYRLDVLRLEIPPLRDRPDDILPLARHVLGTLGLRAQISDDAARLLRAHAWPGNVRELRNAVARAATLGGDLLRASDFVMLQRTAARADGPLASVVGNAERDAISDALDACGGNQTRAARRLGITRRALIYRMEKHGLKPAPRAAHQVDRGEK
ncbi:MAG TPA: FHA domain-containing protein [Polyangiaceae bacterium]|nr:FHA domain-containing protein [Polyangiaceae bacterium]